MDASSLPSPLSKIVTCGEIDNSRDTLKYLDVFRIEPSSNGSVNRWRAPQKAVQSDVPTTRRPGYGVVGRYGREASALPPIVTFGKLTTVGKC